MVRKITFKEAGRIRRAAKLLDGFGYTQLYDLGSLIGWPYGLE